MLSLPPNPSNSLKAADATDYVTPALPALVLERSKSGGVVGIGEVGAAHRLDRPQRVVPTEASPTTVPAAMLTVMPPVTLSSVRNQ